jgi:G3E family GTPase
LQRRSTETVVLASGCVCCTLRGDLPQTLFELLEATADAPTPLRRIVIETSGVSEPMPILQTLRFDRSLHPRFCAGAIVCAVPATEGAGVGDRRESLAQLTAADALVMTKRDLADPGEMLALREALAAMNPLAEWIDHDGAALAAWLGAHEQGSGAYRMRDGPRLPTWPPSANAAHRLRSISVRAPAPDSWARFAVWLTRLIHLHGDRILRVKGVLHDTGRDAWIGVHGVKRFLHPPQHLELVERPADGTTLVFITDGLDPAEIERSYREQVVGVPAEG